MPSFACHAKFGQDRSSRVQPPGRSPSVSLPTVWRIETNFGVSFTAYDAQGGRKGTSAVLSSVEAFSVEEHEWREVAELCRPRAALAAAACQGRLYALGGEVPFILLCTI